MALIKNLRFWLFVALLIGAPLSKYPSIANPAYNFISFRFGFYQALAILFVLLCAVPTIRALKVLFLQNKAAFISGIVLFSTILLGIITALNKSRAILLGLSFVLLLSLVAVTWWYVRFQFPKSKLLKILKIFLISGILFSLLAILEFFVLTLTNAKASIFCQGCYPYIFGFPRINLFAAEPQFLANAMIPFFFISLGIYYFNKSRLALFCLSLSGLAVSLTFSRGAYLALSVGFIFFILALLSAKKIDILSVAKTAGVVVLAFAVGWLMLIWSASYKYTSTPNITYNTARTMLDHMTLGVIQLPEKLTTKSSNNFVSPGLIQASTEDRLGAAKLAIDSWDTNPKTILIGVGPGNLGPFTDKYVSPSAPNNLTVYIYYVLLLSEVGLIGLAAFVLIYLSSIISFIKKYFKDKKWPIYASVASLTLAFLVHYFFFGTFINSVYVWFWTGIILGLSAKTAGKKRYN